MILARMTPCPARLRRAFTLIEVLVVVAIIALLISIMLPSLSRAKELSKRTVCASRLHTIGVAVYTYAQENKGKLIECHGRTTQVAISPRRANPAAPSPTTPDFMYVDWQAQAKKYRLDKTTWECPNREGVFSFEGTPDPNVQGYDAGFLTSQGYRVDQNAPYQQWIIGFQYFGGMREWEVRFTSAKHPNGIYPSRSPVNANAPGHWALAADSNVWVSEGGGAWGGGRRAYMNIPPHPDRNGWPEGGNVLTFDGAATWINEGRMIEMTSWSPDSRRCWFYQQDLGEYGETRRARGLVSGIRKGWRQ